MSQFRFQYKQPVWMPIASLMMGAVATVLWVYDAPKSWILFASLACYQVSFGILLWAAIRARNEYRSRLEADFALHLTNLIRTENPGLVKFDKKMPSAVLEEAIKEVQE